MTTIRFSPPYGDGTAQRWQTCQRHDVFAPLRGWYTTWTFAKNADGVFAPLRGWYFTVKNTSGMNNVFAPYGDGTSMRELVARTGLFSPPYGDGTYGAVSFGLKV